MTMRGWCRTVACAAATASFTVAWAVPLDYRYVGSRVVSAGRVVYWYWNVDRVEIDSSGAVFVARMFARAIDVNQERPFDAIVRCDSRTYRGLDSRGPYEPIDDGEPIAAVWRAGCENGRAVDLRARNVRLGAVAAPDAPSSPPRGSDTAASSAAGTASPRASATAAPASTAVAASSPANPSPAASAPATSTPTLAASRVPDPPKPADAPAQDAQDPRRADACVKLNETRGALAGDATLTNACTYAVEVTLCYKGARGGAYDCPTPARGRRSDSLPAGASHVLPEYRRGRHKGISVVACRGAPGSVFPTLDEAPGKSGCR